MGLRPPTDAKMSRAVNRDRVISLTFFVTSSMASLDALEMMPALDEAYSIRSLTFDPDGQV